LATIVQAIGVLAEIDMDTANRLRGYVGWVSYVPYKMLPSETAKEHFILAFLFFNTFVNWLGV
jgi:hypothetical protein